MVFHAGWIILAAVFGIPALAILFRFVGPIVAATIVAHRGPGLRIIPERRETRLEDLSPEMQEFVGSAVGQFREEGFEVAANTVEEGAYLPGHQSLKVILLNRRIGDTAVIVAILSNVRRKNTISQSRELTLAIGSRFVDGKRITTSSRRTVNLLPKNRDNDSINAAWVREVRPLCEFHRRRVAAAGCSGNKRVVPEEGRELEYSLAQQKELLNESVLAGWRHRDEAAGRYRFTWKGAAIVGWRIVQPMNGWLLKREERRTRREWQKLDMDSWQASASMTPSTSVATPLDDVDRTMAYQSELGEGEVRVDETDTGVIVRVGPPNGKKYLVKKVVSIGGLVFIDFYIAVMLLVIIVAQPQLPSGFQGASQRWTLGAAVAILTGMLIWEIASTIRRYRGVHGMSMVTASREGIEFREANAPEKAMVLNHSEISGFTMASGSDGAFITLRGYRGFKQVIVAGKKPVEVERARVAIVRALGMFAQVNELPAADGTNESPR